MGHDTSDLVKYNIIKSKRIVVPASVIKDIEDKKYFTFRISGYNKYHLNYLAMVYDFTAPEGMVYMGENLMDELCLIEGNTIRLKYVDNIPSGKFVRIRPHHSSFVSISDPRSFLERGITKHYPILNCGERIRIGEYTFDVVHTEPESVISTIDTDLSVDFLEPSDMINSLIK